MSAKVASGDGEAATVGANDPNDLPSGAPENTEWKQIS